MRSMITIIGVAILLTACEPPHQIESVSFKDSHPFKDAFSLIEKGARNCFMKYNVDADRLDDLGYGEVTASTKPISNIMLGPVITSTSTKGHSFFYSKISKIHEGSLIYVADDRMSPLVKNWLNGKNDCPIKE